MKKLLIATLLFTGFAAFVPTASADHCERAFVGYDRHGHPVYREVSRPRSGYYEDRRAYAYPAPRETRYRDYDDDRSYSKKKKHYDTHETRFRSPLSFIFGF